jgi:hypothetical protein
MLSRGDIGVKRRNLIPYLFYTHASEQNKIAKTTELKLRTNVNVLYFQFFDWKYALQLIRRHTEYFASDGSASNLFYLGGAPFESRPEHRLT